MARRIRLNLSITEPVHHRLKTLLEMSDAESLTEVVRRALAYYEMLLTARAEGQEVLIKDKKGLHPLRII